MSEDDAPLKATLKAGESYADPWLSVTAEDPNQLATRLDGVVNAGVGAKVAQAAIDLQANWNAAQGLGAQPVPAQAQDGWGQQPQNTSFPQQQSAPESPNAAGGLQTQTDKYGNRYTRNVPGAPTCPHVTTHGPRILKEGKRKDGSPYKAYICPVVDKFFRVQTDCAPIYQ